MFHEITKNKQQKIYAENETKWNRHEKDRTVSTSKSTKNHHQYLALVILGYKLND